MQNNAQSKIYPADDMSAMDEETVTNLFKNNIVCSQIVFSEFSPELGIPADTAKKTASLFGIGMLCGEVCGAFTGALMAIGLKYGHCQEGDLLNQTMAAAKYAEFKELFEAEFGSIICRDIMKHDPSVPEELKIIREEKLFESVCPKIICRTIDILEELFKN